MSDDDYVYDEDSGEWVSAAELATKRQLATQVEVRDAVGNLLADGDQVTLVKDLDAKFKALDLELNQHQDKSTGDWTFYDELTKDQIRKLSDAVAALGEPISKVAAVVAASA